MLVKEQFRSLSGGYEPLSRRPALHAPPALPNRTHASQRDPSHVCKAAATDKVLSDDPSFDQILDQFKLASKSMAANDSECFAPLNSMMTECYTALSSTDEMMVEDMSAHEALALVLGVLGMAASKGCVNMKSPPADMLQLAKLALRRLKGDDLVNLSALQLVDVLTCILYLIPNSVGIPWCEKLEEALRPRLEELGPEVLAYVLMLCSLLPLTAHWKPSREFLVDAHDYLWPKLSSLPNQSLAYALYGLAHMDMKPDDEQLDVMRSLVQERRSNLDPRDLSLMLVACSRMGVAFNPHSPDPPPPQGTTEYRIPRHLFTRPDTLIGFLSGLSGGPRSFSKLYHMDSMDTMDTVDCETGSTETMGDITPEARMT